ncbi:MAG TPA: hypothetical protein VMS00_04805 [Acidimicrobiales bacterium]|jgi:hypothetical protein|nr:hypothetical protein [Acidimicrobiales bacterium]
MPQIRRVLGACNVETAKRRRVCHRDRRRHAIEQGTLCLVIKDHVTGGSKNYCPQCALAILDQAADDLQALRDTLS